MAPSEILMSDPCPLRILEVLAVARLRTMSGGSASAPREGPVSCDTHVTRREGLRNIDNGSPTT